MDNNMVSQIWVGISTTNFHLLQLEIKGYLNASTSELITKKKRLKVLIIFAILPFFNKNTLTELPPWELWSLLLLMS